MALQSYDRYDTIKLLALKSRRDGQLNLVCDTETKKLGKTENQVTQKKRSGQ